MRQGDFSCLMHTGVPVSDEIRDMLFNMAMALAHSKESKVSIKTPDIEGEVTTVYEYVSFGSYSGIKFKSVLETPDGTMRTEFLMSPLILSTGIPAEFGIWRPIGNMPKGGPARNAGMN